MEKFDIQKVTEKVGGAFRMTVLVQKRVRELAQGMPPLVPVREGMSFFDVVMEEITQDKLNLLEEGDNQQPLLEEDTERTAPKSK